MLCFPSRMHRFQIKMLRLHSKAIGSNSNCLGLRLGSSGSEIQGLRLRHPGNLILQVLLRRIDVWSQIAAFGHLFVQIWIKPFWMVHKVNGVQRDHMVNNVHRVHMVHMVHGLGIKRKRVMFILILLRNHIKSVMFILNLLRNHTKTVVFCEYA